MKRKRETIQRVLDEVAVDLADVSTLNLEDALHQASHYAGFGDGNGPLPPTIATEVVLERLDSVLDNLSILEKDITELKERLVHGRLRQQDAREPGDLKKSFAELRKQMRRNDQLLANTDRELKKLRAEVALDGFLLDTSKRTRKK